MLKDYVINPGIGIGQIKFGIVRDELQNLIGSPDNIESNNDIEDDVDITWEYQGGTLLFYFDEEDKYKLGGIELENPEVELFGAKIFDLTINETKELLDKNDAIDIEEEDVDSEIVLSIDSIGLTLYYENNELDSVQISPLYLDDENFKWPE